MQNILFLKKIHLIKCIFMHTAELKWNSSLIIPDCFRAKQKLLLRSGSASSVCRGLGRMVEASSPGCGTNWKYFLLEEEVLGHC